MTIQDSFTQFLNQNNGQSVEKEDTSNLDQCFDLAFAWCDFIGIPRDSIRHEFAYQIYKNLNPDTTQYFDVIQNTPDGIPQSGDVVVFDTGVGPAGHVSIATGTGDTNTFESFDQNWDTPHFNKGIDANTGLLIPYSRLVTHNYDFGPVLGWLRPKNAPVTPPNGSGVMYKGYDLTNQDSMKVAVDVLVRVQQGEFVEKAKYDSDLKAKDDTITNLNQQISDRNNQITNLQGQISTLTTQVTTLKDQVNTLQQQAIKVPSLSAQLSQAETNLQSARESNVTAQRAIAQYKAQLEAAKPKTLWEKIKFLLQ